MKGCKKLLVMMLVFALTLTSSLATVVVQAEGTTQLAPALGKTPGNSNPLITQKYGADPFAMVYNGRVYIYMTDDNAQWELTPDTANSYTNCRSISIISSADMVNWTDHGKVPVGGRVLADGLAKWATNAWAPAAAWRTINGKDKFFLYFADNAGGVGVLEADSPVGPFHDPIGKQLISRSTPNCPSSTVPWLFDPAVLVDDKDYDNDGVNDAFLYFGGGIDGVDANNPKSSRCVQLGNDMISIVGTPAAIDAPRLFEDSGIHKYNGKYYYSYCSNFSGTNGDGYPPTGTIAYMESDKPLGPFKYIGPILPGPGTFGNGDGGNNHHAIFQFEDTWYITYHTRQVNIAQRLANGQTGQKDYRSPSVSQLSISSAGAITPLQMENKGISQLKSFNPYNPTEAETIGWMGGINTEVCKEASVTGSNVNMDVTNINNGDWVAVGKADFGTGAGTFTAKVACGSVGGTVELHLDSADGTLIGTLPVNYTGGENVWQNEITNVTGATGVHDVYMVFKGAGTNNLFKMDSWQFGQKSAKQLAGINATIDKLKIDTKSGTNTANMVVKAIYTDGTSEDVTSKVTATPAQSGIVNISNGVVTGASYGSTNIGVSYSGKSDTVYVTVKDLDSELTVKNITVDKSTITLKANATASYKVTAEYLDGHTEDVTNIATYTNSDTNVADVSNGKVTGKALGTANVTISFKGTLGAAVTTQMSITVSYSNPYIQNEAESFDNQSGLQTETCGEGTQNVGYAQNNDWMMYSGVDFGSGAASFDARVASNTVGGNIELHLDSLTGPLVGTLSVESTGGWQTYTTKSCTVTGATGIHDLYMKFTGGNDYFFNVNWWKFNSGAVSNKPFTIETDGKLIKTNGIQATIKVGPAQGATAHDGNEIVVFQLMKGTTPISIVALSKDVLAQEKFTAYFNVDATAANYTVRAYVVDKFTSELTNAPISLADFKTLN